MERSRTPSDTTIDLEALLATTQMGLLRLPTHDAEAKRLTLVRALVAAESDLNRALTAHVRCFLVNCQGSRGSGDLASETEQLHAALRRYTRMIQEVVEEYQHLCDSAVSVGRKGAATRETKPPAGTQTATLRRAV